MAAVIFIGLKINDFVPLIFGSKNHEMDHFTSAGKAFGLNFLGGLKLAPHMLHMMAWMLNSIFKSPLVTVISKKTLTLVSASFWDTPKNHVFVIFRVRSKNTVRNDGAGRLRDLTRTRPAIAGELQQTEF